VQLVSADGEEPEFATVVRDGDAVIPKGYHPNVSVPGHRICFSWAMPAHREVVDRQTGVANVHPGFLRDRQTARPPPLRSHGAFTNTMG
jgi:5-deoxy-glucuronate isomerase